MRRRTMLVLALATLPAFTGVATALSPGAVTVTDAWVRWLPGALPAAGYATLTNRGDRDVRLTGADSPDYASVMLHRSLPNSGQMEMVEAVAIAPGKSFALAPGGYHLMLESPRHPIAPGATITLRFEFADGTTSTALVPVRPANAEGPR